MRSIFAAIMLAVSPVSTAHAGPALLFDPANGSILYSEDADAAWHPASLTKIMTAYLTFEALKQGRLKLDQRIPYSALAAEQAPSKLGLPIGAELTVASALKAVIIKSANDVSVMLAEAVAGSQPAFVAMMNNTAERLGMTRTNFVNPNGLPAPQQVTTARDLAKLARAVMRDFPEFSEHWSMNEARIGKIRLATHNGLLRTFEGADGIKTGFICDSGFNVVASATRDGRQLMAVVLGEPTGSARTVRAASLLEHGFQQYGWKMLFGTQTIDSAPLAASAAVTSVRKTVRSYECGGRPPASKKKKNGAGKPKKKKQGAASINGANLGVDTIASPPANTVAAATENKVQAAQPAPPTKLKMTTMSP